MDADSGQILQLNSIYLSDDGIASARASDALLALDEMEYEEPIQLPDLSKTSEVNREFEELLSPQPPPMLPLSPNQDRDLLILEYKLEVEAKGIIEIVDVNGIIVQTVQIYPISDQVSIITRDWKQGIYLASLKAGGTLLEGAKFTLYK